MKNNDLKQEKESFFIIEKLNDALERASKTEPKKSLFLELIKEEHFSILFADNGAGKSIYAVQIANEIAKQGYRVAFFDFELDIKEFEERYSECREIDGKKHFFNKYTFSENFIRIEVNPNFLDFENYEKLIFEEVEKAIISNELQFLIFDNITALMMEDSKDTKAVIALIRNLKKLIRKYETTCLVLAHTPKRNPYNPILKTDLAGTKVLSDLSDSIFGIGVSVKGNDIRYVKQLKFRGKKHYEADNVICYEIVKETNFLHFKHTGFCHEKEHLLEKPKNEKQLRAERVRELKKENLSLSLAQIAEKINQEFADLEPITKQGVNHILTKNDLL